jgi:hypothetical protein
LTGSISQAGRILFGYAQSGGQSNAICGHYQGIVFERSCFFFDRRIFESVFQAEWESAEERRERLKQEEEMMNAMEEDDDY